MAKTKTAEDEEDQEEEEEEEEGTTIARVYLPASLLVIPVVIDLRSRWNHSTRGGAGEVIGDCLEESNFECDGTKNSLQYIACCGNR